MSKICVTIVLACALVFVAGALQASVVTIYSQNFDAALVGTPLNSLGWTPWDTPQAQVGNDLHTDMLGHALDASVGGYARYGLPLAVPAGATALDLSFKGYWYSDGSSVYSWMGFGYETGPGDPNAAFYNGYDDALGGVYLRLGSQTTSGITYVCDETTTNTIHVDLVNLTVTGSIEGSWLAGARYWSTPQAISSAPTHLFYDADDRWGAGLDIDDIVVTATLPGPVLDGTITLENWTPWRVDRELIPVRVEVANLGGTVVFQKVVVLDSSNHYDVQLPGDFPDGSYNIYFSAAKWLREMAGPVTITQGLNTTVSPTLVNGDVDGDNHLTSTDMSAVLANLDALGN